MVARGLVRVVGNVFCFCGGARAWLHATTCGARSKLAGSRWAGHVDSNDGSMRSCRGTAVRYNANDESARMCGNTHVVESDVGKVSSTGSTIQQQRW